MRYDVLQVHSTVSRLTGIVAIWVICAKNVLGQMSIGLYLALSQFNLELPKGVVAVGLQFPVGETGFNNGFCYNRNDLVCVFFQGINYKISGVQIAGVAE